MVQLVSTLTNAAIIAQNKMPS